MSGRLETASAFPATFSFASRTSREGLMVSPAVSTPATTSGSDGGSTPASAGNEQPGSGAPPQGALEQGNPPASGTGGQEPAGGGDQQTPPGNTTEPKPTPEAPPATPKADEPRRLTQAEWEDQQKAIERQKLQDEWTSKAKDLHTSAPVSARDALDTLSEALDVRIPAELRKPLLDLVNDLVQHGTRGAELKYADEYRPLKETLDLTSAAFMGALDDAAMLDKFRAAVRGQEPETWVKTLLDLKTPAITAKAAENHVTAQAALLPDGEARDGFTAKVKGEHDPKKIAQAFHDALVAVVGPGGEPRVASRPAPSLTDNLTFEEARTLPVPELVKRRAAART